MSTLLTELKQAQIDNSVDTRLTVQGHMFLVAKKIMPNIVAVIIVKYTLCYYSNTCTMHMSS